MLLFVSLLCPCPCTSALCQAPTEINGENRNHAKLDSLRTMYCRTATREDYSQNKPIQINHGKDVLHYRPHELNSDCQRKGGGGGALCFIRFLRQYLRWKISTISYNYKNYNYKVESSHSSYSLTGLKTSYCILLQGI